VSTNQCVLKGQGTNNLLHLLDVICPLFFWSVMRCIYGGHIGGSEHIHQEEGCWLGFRRNLQALGVAQGGLGQGLQHWGGPLGWQLSSLPVHHKSCYGHKTGTQQLPVSFEV